MSFFNFILFFFPSKLNIWIRRVALKQRISKKAKISIFSYIGAKNVTIGKNSTIGSFSFINAESLSIGASTNISSFVRLKSRIVEIGSFTNISKYCIIYSTFTKASVFKLGDHSWVFSFCYFDTGKGLYIGNNVGTGGYTLIFTHSYWGDYMRGAFRTLGKVVIEDDVWMAWRAFVPPNITIGKGSLVSANTFVSKNVKPQTLVAGNPMKEITNLRCYDIDDEKDFLKIKRRAITICKSFINHLEEEYNWEKGETDLENNLFHIKDGIKIKIVAEQNDFLQVDSKTIIFDISRIENESLKETNSYIDYLSKQAFNYKMSESSRLFVNYLRTYGIRLYLVD